MAYMYAIARGAALIVFVLFSASLLILLYQEWRNPELRSMVTSHFPAVIGIPAAGVFSFLVVALFEGTAGKVKFEVLTVKFEGAAGPIIMWMFCFLATVLGIRTLWPLT